MAHCRHGETTPPTRPRQRPGARAAWLLREPLRPAARAPRDAPGRRIRGGHATAVRARMPGFEAAPSRASWRSPGVTARSMHPTCPGSGVRSATRAAPRRPTTPRPSGTSSKTCACDGCTCSRCVTARSSPRALAVAYPAQITRVVIAPAPAREAHERPPGAEAPDWERALLRGLTDYPPRERLTALTARLLVLRPPDEPAQTASRVREALPTARVQELGVPGGVAGGGARAIVRGGPRLPSRLREIFGILLTHL